MFINETVIAVVFRLFNFCLVIALAVYAFKKYIMPQVLILMAKNEAEQKYLQSQQIILEQRQFELDQLIKKDVTLCEQYKSKIDEWRRVVNEVQAIQEKDYGVRRSELVKKYIKKEELRKAAFVQSLVAQKVVSDLRSSLSEYFEKDGVGEDYLEKMVRFMNERAL